MSLLLGICFIRTLKKKIYIVLYVHIVLYIVLHTHTDKLIKHLKKPTNSVEFIIISSKVSGFSVLKCSSGSN